MINFLKKYWVFIVLFLVVLCAYGQTVFMYFWQDDSALIFRLQNPVGPMGSFGPSIWADRGPYRYMVIPFVPFYPLFGLEPAGYFLVGLLTYFAATLCFYLFAKELFKNSKATFVAALIFAAGYIGSDTMFRIINSWQSNIGLMLSTLTLFFYTRFIYKSERKYYFISLLSYLATIELVYVRSHSFIGSIVILDLILKTIPDFYKKKWRVISDFLFRVLPFASLFYFWYLRDPIVGSGALSQILKGQIAVLAPFFATIGNTLFPSVISSKLADSLGGSTHLLIFVAVTICFGAFLYKTQKNKALAFGNAVGNLFLFLVNYTIYLQEYFWYKDLYSYISALIGLLLVFNLFFIGILNWRRKDNLGKILIIGLVILASQVFGYFSEYPTAVFTTTHRYLTFAFIGYAVVYASIFALVGRKFFYIGTIALILVNLILGMNYQARLLRDRSIPSRNFYKTLLEEIPSIEKNSIFYFDILDHPFYRQQFGDFFSVGSMPESTALAIYYGLDRDDIAYITNFDELTAIISNDPQKLDKTYFIYYGASGLENKTEEMRRQLRSKNAFVYVVPSSQTSQKTVLSPVAPFQSLSYTYLNIVTRTGIDLRKISAKNEKDINEDQLKQIFSYLEAKEDYYKTSKAESLSEWKYQEIGYVLDNNLDTSWRGHRIYWDDNEHDEVVVDLGRPKTVSRVLWTNWINSLSPTTYKIETSLDGKNWEVVSSVDSAPARAASGEVVEKFEPRLARYVKMNIEATLTNDSPGIIEIEVIESRFDNLDLENVKLFLSSPYTYITDTRLINQYASQLAKITYMNIVLETDKGKISKVVPVGGIGFPAVQHVYFPQHGTEVKNITVEVPLPLTLEVESASLRSLNLNDLRNLGLLKSFSKN